MGRPNEPHAHVFPAGRYVAAFEDDGGVYFQAERPVQASSQRGIRARPGGIYLPAPGGEPAWAYFGHAEGVSFRLRLPGRCAYALGKS